MAVLRCLVMTAALAAVGSPALAQDETTWNQLRPDVVGARVLEESTGQVTLVAPKRAEDAAMVPIEVRLEAVDGPSRIAKLTLVVDENPAPVVGTFMFPAPQQTFDFTVRVRVNAYSFVRAVAETADGRLYMAKAYVKAAGGCSAPAVKDPAEARAHVGEMRFRTFAADGEAQVQVRHPNYSGMQMDQVTRLYTPAWYVQELTVKQGDTPIFAMTGGISVAEDPTVRFTYKGTGEPVSVEAKDSDGQVYRKTFPPDAS